MLNRLKNAMATLAGDIPDYPRRDKQDDGRKFVAGSLVGGIRRDGRRPEAEGRLPYSRPNFLRLNADEVVASGDKTSRPIILPRDVSKVPWCAGYAEVINAGKSDVNEDQARAERIILKNQAHSQQLKEAKKSKGTSAVKQKEAESIISKEAVQSKEANTSDAVLPLDEKNSSSADDLPKQNRQKVQNNPSNLADNARGATISEEGSSSVDDKSKHENFDSREKVAVGVANNAGIDKSLLEQNEDESNSLATESEQITTLTYFGIFDGHAGYGAAVMAAASLHYIITDNLLSIIEILSLKKSSNEPRSVGELAALNRADLYSCCMCNCHRHQAMQKSKAPITEIVGLGGPMPFIDKSSDLTVEELVIGAIEKSFQEMDKAIFEAKERFQDSLGGCTALAALFFMGRLFIANAGDCRAVICENGKAFPASFDFTPETERKRLFMLANLFPHLLHNEFTDREFVRRPTRKDLGKRLLCREAWMSGWSFRTIAEEDLRTPLVTGEGKRARLLATIGVTRGFGDHNLRLYDSEIRIKPFLSSVPDIKVLDMSGSCYSENDVLIMASDGLWDVVSSDDAASIVQNSLSTVEISNPKRYTLAAQDLLMHARGMHPGQWKTVDDVTVFVIPLHCYGNNNSKV